MNQGGVSEIFARSLLKEEEGKLARLTSLSATIGLPVYETFEFLLPTQAEKLLRLVSHLTRDQWKLSCRMMNVVDGRLVFRHLDIDVNIATAAIAEIPQDQRCTASISPYKEPTISGTALVSRGNANLEMVYGPHFWLTKAAPEGIDVLRCWYSFPSVSIRYSTPDPAERLTLFVHLKRVLDITLGLSIKHVRDAESALYAEYHWRADLGYRFLDCSYSRVWTGSARDRSAD